MRARVKIAGFDEVADKLARANVNVERVSKRALLYGAIKTQQEINKAAAHYHKTGAMEQSEIRPHVESVGAHAYRAKVGFDMSKGGAEHALILNYGSPRKVIRNKKQRFGAWHFVTNAIRRTRRDRQEAFQNLADDALKELQQ